MTQRQGVSHRLVVAWIWVTWLKIHHQFGLRNRNSLGTTSRGDQLLVVRVFVANSGDVDEFRTVLDRRFVDDLGPHAQRKHVVGRIIVSRGSHVPELEGNPVSRAGPPAHHRGRQSPVVIGTQKTRLRRRGDYFVTDVGKTGG